MLEILGYLLLMGIAILVLKFAFSLILRCSALGIIAFLCVGAVTGALCIFGVISYDTAWTISKWAFYIGLAINIIDVIFHPFRAISDAWESATEDSGSNSYDSSDNSKEDEFAGMSCCGNCRRNTSPGRVGVNCPHDISGEYMSRTDCCCDYFPL